MFEALAIKTIRHRFMTQGEGMLHLAKQIWQLGFAGSNAGIFTIPKGEDGFRSVARKGMGRADGTWLAPLATAPE